MRIREWARESLVRLGCSGATGVAPLAKASIQAPQAARRCAARCEKPARSSCAVLGARTIPLLELETAAPVIWLAAGVCKCHDL